MINSMFGKIKARVEKEPLPWTNINKASSVDFNLDKHLDPRIEKITDLVVNYSMGNFEAKLEPSGQYDEVDAFITIMNMVGEELKASTISRNYFNDIFNSVSEMLFVLDNEGRVLSINNTVTEKLGYSENQLREKKIDGYLTRKPGAFKILNALHENNYPVDEETYFYSHEGKAVPVFCSSSYLFNQGQKRIGFLIIARDLSKIRKYERSLRESEERYRRIFEESNDSLFIAGKNGVFRDLNSAGFRLLKCSDGRTEGINFFALFYEESSKIRFRQEIFDKGIVVDFKTRLMDAQGNFLDCLVSANTILNEAGEITDFQGIIKDISEQRAMENLVIRTIVDTQEKERKRFAMDLHDSLGQQLSAIKFYLATLKSSASSNTSKSTEILSKSNDALDRVLIELRNICFNLMPGTLQSFGLKFALQELCKKIEFDSLLEFKIDLENSVPDLEKSLEIAIFRIVQEFITNSIRHGHAKCVEIQMRLEKKDERIEFLVLNLKDNGEGFDVNDVCSYPGMGLKNVRSRVESYNGDIHIFSTPGEGTGYEVVIPLSDSFRQKNNHDQIMNQTGILIE
jgi:PAS domain S-box-containing protein